VISSMWSKWNTRAPKLWGIKSEIHVDMGCGYHPRNPFEAEKLLGVDIISGSSLHNKLPFEYLQVTPGQEIPLASESVDSISGYDFLEHLGRGDGVTKNHFIDFMNEAYRILRPGGVMLFVTPSYPSPAVFQDPTHVNFISVKTVEYFIGEKPIANRMGYGFDGSFELVAQFWMGPFSKIFADSDSTKGWSIFQKIKAWVSLSKSRRALSCLRNPTHLVWLLKKPTTK